MCFFPYLVIKILDFVVDCSQTFEDVLCTIFWWILTSFLFVRAAGCVACFYLCPSKNKIFITFETEFSPTPVCFTINVVLSFFRGSRAQNSHSPTLFSLINFKFSSKSDLWENPYSSPLPPYLCLNWRKCTFQTHPQLWK